MERETRLELATLALARRCSTTELLPLVAELSIPGRPKSGQTSGRSSGHTAIGEAPTAGSVVLAAILLKMGGYGFLRFSIPMFPEASHDFAPLIFALSVIAIVYTSLVALMQEDVKKLIAYSSVAHMGFVTMGLFAMNQQGVQGAVYQMVSHGLVSGALFLCVGVVYDRLHTREIAAYGGLVRRMPRYAVAFMVFTLAVALQQAATAHGYGYMQTVGAGLALLQTAFTYYEVPDKVGGKDVLGPVHVHDLRQRHPIKPIAIF